MALDIHSFRKVVTELNLFTESDVLVVGVSGGIDSIVLCHILHHAGYRFVIAHINYHLRDAESDADENFVCAFANQLGVECLIHEADIENKESGIQEKARDIRYKWFRDICTRHSCGPIVTGHHMDDQAETILHQFIRGGGARALSGMAPHSDGVARPLLRFSRGDIEQYARTNQLTWRDDSSNDSVKYTRNLIRKELLPVMKTVNPAIVESLALRAGLFSEIDALIGSVIPRDLEGLRVVEADTESISIESFRNYPYRRLLLWNWLSPFGFLPGQMQEIDQLSLRQSGAHVESGSHTVWREHDKLLLAPSVETNNWAQEITALPWAQEMTYPVRIEECAKGQWFRDPNNETQFLSAEKLAMPLIVRNWKEGDRFKPLGMSGTQKISDFLIQRKIPLRKKPSILVLESSGTIAAIIGLAISEEFKVTETSSTLLRITSNIAV